MVERLHRQLKAALMCHNDTWARALPLVLLGIRTALKEDLKTSSAELLYGEPLRLPGELLAASFSTERSEDISDFVVQLRKKMAKLRPTAASHHAQQQPFIFRDLPTASHVFLRDDTVRRPLQQPYTGPYKIINRKEKTMTINIRGKSVEVSLDRIKPAHIEQFDTPPETTVTTSVPVATAANSPDVLLSTTKSTDPKVPSEYTTRSGRKVHFSKPFDL